MIEAASLIEKFPYLGIFLLLLLGDVGFPFPEDTILIMSGFLLSQQIIQPLPTFLVIYGSLILTDFLLYHVGKKYGREVVEHRRFQKIISAQRLSKLEEKFKKWGIWVVFFGRHIFGIRAQVFLTAGVMRMSTIRFLIADAASAIITVTVMVGIGYFGGNRIQILKKDVARIEHITVIALTLLLAAGILYWYFHNLRNSRK